LQFSFHCDLRQPQVADFKNLSSFSQDFPRNFWIHYGVFSDLRQPQVGQNATCTVQVDILDLRLPELEKKPKKVFPPCRDLVARGKFGLKFAVTHQTYICMGRARLQVARSMFGGLPSSPRALIAEAVMRFNKHMHVCVCVCVCVCAAHLLLSIQINCQVWKRTHVYVSLNRGQFIDPR